MVRVTLDETHLAIFDGDVDAAAAGAHVASGGLDFALSRRVSSHE
jgi:hypothetical protein